MKINLPKDVSNIINMLNQGGFAAYAVGGAVRDCILLKKPSDWDITTSAEPKDVKRIFPSVVDTGIAHGTVTVCVNGGFYEVTTFRSDGRYTDNRRPECVEFKKDVLSDLSRRDFTINAICYNDAEGLVDPYNGIEDIKAGVIKVVGDADKRFKEDALRMLRAVRFSAQLGFSIDNSIKNAIIKNHSLILKISAERVRDELTKILLSPHPDNIFFLYECGLLEDILPELCRCFVTEQNIKYHIYDVGRHILEALRHTESEFCLRYATLLHDIGKPASKTTDEDGTDHFKGHGDVSVQIAQKILCRLKFDNKSTDKILRLIKHHDREILPEKKYVKRALNCVGDDIFPLLMKLKRADALAQNPEVVKERLVNYTKIEEIYREIKESGDALFVSELAVDGHDIMAAGYSGKQIGLVLDRLLSHILDTPEDNNHESLLKLIEKNKNLWLNDK